MTKSILVLCAHPDDEVLGCGGTIAKFSNKGYVVHVAFLADGVSSRSNFLSSNSLELEQRRNATKVACSILGINSISFENYPDNRLDTIPLLSIVQIIEALIFKHKPEIVLTHHAGDLNIDHRRVYDAAATACRPQKEHPVKTFLSFEVASSTEWQIPFGQPAFIPNWFVDVTDTFDKKVLALEAYSVEMREWPHPRSIKGIKSLGNWRGATVGVNFAEAFMLGRRIE